MQYAKAFLLLTHHRTNHFLTAVHGKPCIMAQAQGNLLVPLLDHDDHPIFDDIKGGNLEAVQERVLADAAVLEQRRIGDRWTPLMAAIALKKPAIALWLIQHRGQHSLETADGGGWTALHYASTHGPLAVVQALVAAGANPAALTARGSTPSIYASSTGANPAALGGLGWTPLMCASARGFTDIVVCLLQLPAVKASIDHIHQDSQCTALSYASRFGHQPTVQLLLDAGADPTIPAGPRSPLRQALDYNHHAIAALLSHTINEADRVRMCVALVGLRKGLYKNLYGEVLGYSLHAWAAKGQAGEDSE
jgi:ankyrin repeat protein